MYNLKRLQVGKFNIKDAIDIQQLESNPIQNLIPFENMFQDKQVINLSNKKLELFLNGVRLSYNLEENIYRIYNNQKFIGIGIIENNLLKRDIVL